MGAKHFSTKCAVSSSHLRQYVRIEFSPNDQYTYLWINLWLACCLPMPPKWLKIQCTGCRKTLGIRPALAPFCGYPSRGDKYTRNLLRNRHERGCVLRKRYLFALVVRASHVTARVCLQFVCCTVLYSSLFPAREIRSRGFLSKRMTIPQPVLDVFVNM